VTSLWLNEVIKRLLFKIFLRVCMWNNILVEFIMLYLIIVVHNAMNAKIMLKYKIWCLGEQHKLHWIVVNQHWIEGHQLCIYKDWNFKNWMEILYLILHWMSCVILKIYMKKNFDELHFLFITYFLFIILEIYFNSNYYFHVVFLLYIL